MLQMSTIGIGKLESDPPILSMQFLTVCYFCRTEKNASQWSKDKLESLLAGLEIKGNAGKCLSWVYSVLVHLSKSDNHFFFRKLYNYRN